MKDPQNSAKESVPVRLVSAGHDLAGEHRGLGISAIVFKVVPRNGSGLLILENTFHAKGGPPRHLHVEQDEWFYALHGEFVVEIGTDRFRMHPGDSVLAPRNIPHVWAHAGNGNGSMLITFSPAGMMEGFFREVTKANAMPSQDPGLWRAHGMEVVGPPLAIDTL